MNIISQILSNWSKIVLILVITAVLLGIVGLLHLYKEVPIGHLTRDPTAITHVSFYIGFLSQVGIFFWAATAAICMFSGNIIQNHPETVTIKRFLYFAATLTLILSLDDIFQFHENVEEEFGIPEKIVFSLYGGFALSFIALFYRVILKTNYTLFIIALGFFGLSMIIDKYYYRLPDALDLYLFEDGTKMAGIVSWFIYFSNSAKLAISKQVTLKNLSPTESEI